MVVIIQVNRVEFILTQSYTKAVFVKKKLQIKKSILGGAGYVLSAEAFKRLGEKLAQNLTNCPLGPYEDVEVHACLRRLGVHKNSSIDELGRERFHPKDIWSTWVYNSSSDDGWGANPVLGVNMNLISI